MKAFKRRFGPPVFGGYGSSENAIVMIPSPGQPPEALGVPRPGLDVAIIDPATERSAPRPGSTPTASWSTPTRPSASSWGATPSIASRATTTTPRPPPSGSRNGWYWSGDLAYRDEDGRLLLRRPQRRLAPGRRGELRRRTASSGSLQRFPGVTGVAVFGVPDDRTVDDQVMAVIELADGAELDPAAFDAFLADQTRPRHEVVAALRARSCNRLPVTATNKIDKAPLRRERWISTGDDPVYWRPERRDRCGRLTDDDRSEILRRFESNGRARLLSR